MAPPIVIPAPTFRDGAGTLDRTLVRRYARHLASTWVQYIIASGSTGLGECATQAERALLLDLWLEHVTPARLIAGCWAPADTAFAVRRGVRPLLILCADSERELIKQLAAVPESGLAYVNPRYSSVRLESRFVSRSVSNFQGSGLKVSKITFDTLREIRAVVGRRVQLIHGSSRDIARSLAVGADLVTASPLAAIPSELPCPSIEDIQCRVDALQVDLDTQADHRARVEAITDCARRALAPSYRHCGFDSACRLGR